MKGKLNWRGDQISSFWLFAIAAMPSVVALVFYLTAAFTTPFEVNYGEGTTLYLSTHLGQFYQPLQEPPFILSIYPPIYATVTAGVTQLLDDPFFAGRLVSLLAAGISTFFLITSIRNIRGDCNTVLPIVLGLAFLLSPVVGFKYGIFARVDMLGVAFGSAAIAFYLRLEGQKQLLTVSILLVAMLFTKQSLIALPIAIAVTEFINHRYIRSVKFGILTGIIGLSILGVLVVLSDGVAWTHLVEYNQSVSFSIYHSLTRLAKFVAVVSPLLGALTLAGISNRSKISPQSFPFVYVTVAFILTVFYLTRSGTSLNHALELLLALHLFAGLIVPKVGKVSLSSQFTAGQILTVFLSAQLLLPSVAAATVLAPVQAPTGASAVASNVSEINGPVLSEDVGLTVHSDRAITNDPLLLNQLAEQGTWNGSLLTERLRRGNISCIVLKRTLAEAEDSYWTEDTIIAIRRNYQQSTQIGEYHIYGQNNSNAACNQ